jgi:hypothetical protein
MNESKRKQNEKEFEHWNELENNGRLYWFSIQVRTGGKAVYLKEVNADETTISFVQEIYNAAGELIELHKKYPIDEGHKKIKRNDH